MQICLEIMKQIVLSFIFYVDKANGTTRMVEKVPSLNIEEDAGTIELFDYLEKK
jgi:hypothetical protein